MADRVIALEGGLSAMVLEDGSLMYGVREGEWIATQEPCNLREWS